MDIWMTLRRAVALYPHKIAVVDGWGKFDKSIDEAKKWMFTIQELTPEK